MYVYGLYVCVDAYNGRMYVFLFLCVYMHMQLYMYVCIHASTHVFTHVFALHMPASDHTSIQKIARNIPTALYSLTRDNSFER